MAIQPLSLATLLETGDDSAEDGQGEQPPGQGSPGPRDWGLLDKSVWASCIDCSQFPETPGAVDKEAGIQEGEARFSEKHRRAGSRCLAEGQDGHDGTGTDR